MANVLGISGSLRERSYNTALLRAAAELAPEGFRIEPVRLDGIPPYNADVEQDEGPPPTVTSLKDRLAAADGVIIATPEYNAGIPGVAKNAIDWLSRPADDIPRVFGDLPVGLIGGGGRGGTRFAQAAWLPVLRYLETRPWHGQTLFVASVRDAFDDELRLTDEKIRELLERYVSGFAEFCGRFPRRPGQR